MSKAIERIGITRRIPVKNHRDVIEEILGVYSGVYSPWRSMNSDFYFALIFTAGGGGLFTAMVLGFKVGLAWIIAITISAYILRTKGFFEDPENDNIATPEMIEGALSKIERENSNALLNTDLSERLELARNYVKSIESKSSYFSTDATLLKRFWIPEDHVVFAENTASHQLALKKLESPIMYDSSDFLFLHDAVVREFNTFQMDMLEVIKLPLIGNLSHPTTREFHQALSYAEKFKPTTSQIQAGHPFIKASVELKTLWDRLRQEARLEGVRSFGEDEMSKLELAKSLIEIARSEGSSHSERSLSYKKAIEILEGIIDIPEKAIFVLEQMTRKSITS